MEIYVQKTSIAVILYFERAITINWPLIFSLMCSAQNTSELAPHHLVDDAHVALHYLDDLGADVLVNIVGHGDAVLAVAAQLDGGVDGLEERVLVDAGNDEVALVDGLGTLRACADADGGEGVAYACEER